MDIYLIRHGIAVERGTYVDDRERPLIQKGRNKTTKVAESLLDKGIKFDLILTSPLVRAYQTAEILQQGNLAEDIEVFDALKPDGNIHHLIRWLEQKNESQIDELALVKHQPDLGNWVEMLIWGRVKGQIIVKKAGVVGIELPNIGTPIARSTLFLLTSPKWVV